MKVFLFAVFVALAAAAPVEDAGNFVDVVVNGVAEGEALEIGDIVDIKLKEHVNGEVAATADLLHPFTALGIAEIAAAAEPEPVQVVDIAEDVYPSPAVIPENVVDISIGEPPMLVEEPEVLPQPVVLPVPLLPEVAPEPVVLPAPVLPEVAPELVVLPEPVVPEVVPEPVVLPEPIAPEVVESAPEPQPPNGVIYNDGTVQVEVNMPEDAGVFASLQSWFNMVISYFNQGVQTTQQIV